MKYIIEGGKKLTGEVIIGGNKNAIFPVVAACLLTNEEVILENITPIKDTEVLVEILKALGIQVEWKNSSLVIKAENIRTSVLPKELMRRLRGSIVLAGSILSRLGRVTFSHPGGDIIGKRSIESHLDGFKELGAIVKKGDLDFKVSFPAGFNKDKGCDIFLYESSVTGAENLILASVIGNRIIKISNCPIEPHITDLCKILLQMGANMEGIGTSTLVIKGVGVLRGTKFRIGSDYIEAGTYAVAAAITGGEINIKNVDETDLRPVLIPLMKFGIEIKNIEGGITVFSKRLKSVSRLHTNIWPGFPTDMISAAIVLATQSKGVTLCHDWMYESRMFFVDKLISMGAHITLADPHRCMVEGPFRLRGRDLESPDIRAGMALVLAALVAKGSSVIHRAELIERGYEDPVDKLKKLGAEIKRVE